MDFLAAISYFSPFFLIFTLCMQETVGVKWKKAFCAFRWGK